MNAHPLLDDLHLLRVLAHTRSFTQTAVRLGLSKATVSARIAELEKTSGVPLVHRTTRAVSLTDAGHRFVSETHAAFEQIEQSYLRIKDLAGHPRGLIRMTAPVALGRQRLAPSIPRFLRQYPEIQVELDLNDRIVRLAQEGFDLAIRHTGSAPDTHVAWELASSRTLLVASPPYLAQQGMPAHPLELARHNCLAYLREGGSTTWNFELAGKRRRPETVAVSVNGRFRANNSEVLREMVLAGAGIALLPDFSAQRFIAEGTLTHLLPAWRSVGTFGERIFAIRPYSPQVPQAVQRMIEFLRLEWAEQPPA